MSWVTVPQEITVDVEMLSGLIERIGTADFDIALLHFINDISPVRISEVCGYVSSVNSAPTIVGWCGVRADTSQRIESYLATGYEHDPVLLELPETDRGSCFFMHTLPAKTLVNEEYRRVHFEVPNFRTEVAVVRRERTGWNIAKFFLEDDDLPEGVALKIGQVAALVYPIGKQHAIDEDNSVRLAARPRVEDRLATLLEERFPQITPRERQVCTLTILGKSTQTIATSLSISPSTVITYRQRVYDRLGVNNTNALVGELL